MPYRKRRISCELFCVDTHFIDRKRWRLEPRQNHRVFVSLNNGSRNSALGLRLSRRYRLSGNVSMRIELSMRLYLFPILNGHETSFGFKLFRSGYLSSMTTSYLARQISFLFFPFAISNVFFLQNNGWNEVNNFISGKILKEKFC